MDHKSDSIPLKQNKIKTTQRFYFGGAGVHVAPMIQLVYWMLKKKIKINYTIFWAFLGSCFILF